MKRFVVALLGLCLAFSVAKASGKVALVIGNGNYVNANVLPNPPNDATDMSAALQNLGFTVIGGTDLDYAAMGEKIGAFEDAARDADLTLFFYAGHGLQVNGRNYLVPTNAKLDRESSLQFEAIDADTVLSSMTGPGKTAIALLDACRDNPLSRSLARSLSKTRSTAVAQGLAVPSLSGGGMLIGFSTAPGEVAADGEGHNSPFTAALLKNLNTPGLEIQQLMTRVKADVYEATKETQEPWHNSSLRNEVYLVPAGIPPKQDAETPSAPQQSAIEAEWNAVKESKSEAVLDAFIADHADNKVFVALAQERKTALAAESTTALLDSLRIPDEPKTTSREVALSSPYKISTFFEDAKAANDLQNIYALLGPPSVELKAPSRNLGSKTPALALQNGQNAPTLEALLAGNTALSFDAEKSTACRLDWLDRCPFLPTEMVANLTKAMADQGMDINKHEGNYFQINRIAGRSDYLISNSPAFAEGKVAIVAAIITPDLTVNAFYGFDLSREKLGLEASDVASPVAITWAAAEGDDIYLSFDSNYRCTPSPRKFGFIAKFSISDRSLKWVSPLNVSDVNFIIQNDTILSANGGSCVDDYLYQLDSASGKVIARYKTPNAVERMQASGGTLVLQLYEGAASFNLP